MRSISQVPPLAGKAVTVRVVKTTAKWSKEEIGSKTGGDLSRMNIEWYIENGESVSR
jgi:hypothetical protein